MNILLLLIPVALIIVSVALWFFFWAVRSEQFDDLDRQGANILFDDDLPPNLSELSAAAQGEKDPSDSISPLTNNNNGI